MPSESHVICTAPGTFRRWVIQVLSPSNPMLRPWGKEGGSVHVFRAPAFLAGLLMPRPRVACSTIA